MVFGAVGTQTAAARGGCGKIGRVPGAQSVGELRAETICLVNRARAANGLAALNSNPKLRKAAQRHSKAMVRYDFLSHTGGSTIQQRVKRAGYLAGVNRFGVGEVIGAGLGRGGSPRGMVRRWMRSSIHRSEILSPGFRDIGVGVAHGFPGAGRRGATYTIDFGWRS